MIDYAALKRELANPLYGGLSDVDAAAAVNAKTITVAKDTTGGFVRAVLFARRKWPAIVKLANAARAGTDTSDLAVLCQTIYDVASDKGEIAMTDAETAAAVEASLAGLVQAEVISSGDKDALLALGTETRNWAKMQFGSQVTDYDVSLARAMP